MICTSRQRTRRYRTRQRADPLKHAVAFARRRANSKEKRRNETPAQTETYKAKRRA